MSDPGPATISDAKSHQLKLWLIRTCGFVLLVLSVSKFISVYSGSKALHATDPLTGISYGILLIAAATVEGIVGFSSLFFPKRKASLWALGWVGVILAGYRCSRLVLGIHGPCKCMGEILQWWPWLDRYESVLSWTIILIILGIAGRYIIFPTSPNLKS